TTALTGLGHARAITGTYDLLDQLTTLAGAEDPTGRTDYAWDGAGRLTAVTLPDGSQARYRYDGDGNLREEQAIAAGGTFTRSLRYSLDVAVPSPRSSPPRTASPPPAASTATEAGGRR